MEGELLYSGLIKLFQREFSDGTDRFSRHNFLQGHGGMKVTLLLNRVSGNCRSYSSGNFNWFLRSSGMKRKLLSFQLHHSTSIIRSSNIFLAKESSLF